MATTTPARTRLRRLALTLLVGVAALVMVVLPALAATTNVQIGDNFFSPEEVTINVGDTVRWTYNGTVDHNVVDKSGQFASDRVTPLAPFQYTYAEAGTFPYFCAYHGDTQSGVVTVVDPNKPSPTPTPSPTPSPTASPTPTPVPTPTPSPTAAPTPSPEPTPTPSPTAASTPDEPTAPTPVATETVTEVESEVTTPGESTNEPEVETGSPSASPSATETEVDVVAVTSPSGGSAGRLLKALATLLVIGSTTTVLWFRRA